MQNEYNSRIVEEFRANGGEVGGQWPMPLLLLTTTGARSGERRTRPLGYIPDGNRLIVIASNHGAQSHPDWYHNLAAHPYATVEIGLETFDAYADLIEGEERHRLWRRIVELYPFFAERQAKTARQLPVIALSR